MEYTSTQFECEVENLYYTTIEEKIALYFDMGYPDNSSIPPKMQENSYGEYTLVCTNKSGKFFIRNYKQKDGKYLLFVSLCGKLHKV